jgi:tetratricopeptide (TPR) repeat protein
MFFPRLRRRAKWVFAFLAVAFGLGFVVFGVGTGISGTSLGDIFQDILQQRAAEGSASVNDAREKVEANPRDAAAQLELANALQAEGQIQEAIVALERYAELRPNDTDGLQQLAVLWGTQAARARQDAEAAAAEAQEANLAGAFAQGDSPFVQTLYQTKISESISQLANARSTEAQTRALDASRNEADIYERLSSLLPDEPVIFLQLGQASFAAGDTPAAIAAWERFLELAPDDASAPLIQQQLELLKGDDRGGSSG